MKPLLNVVAGILWHGGAYLAVERPEGVKMAGCWEFPGGKIERGETGEEALIRELQEELGVTPTVFDYWRTVEHEYDEFLVHVRFFHVTEFAGELTALENQRMKWVDPSLPPSLNYLPADTGIVEALHG